MAVDWVVFYFNWHITIIILCVNKRYNFELIFVFLFYSSMFIFFSCTCFVHRYYYLNILQLPPKPYSSIRINALAQSLVPRFHRWLYDNDGVRSPMESFILQRMQTKAHEVCPMDGLWSFPAISLVVRCFGFAHSFSFTRHRICSAGFSCCANILCVASLSMNRHRRRDEDWFSKLA